MCKLIVFHFNKFILLRANGQQAASNKTVQHLLVQNIVRLLRRWLPSNCAAGCPPRAAAGCPPRAVVISFPAYRYLFLSFGFA